MVGIAEFAPQAQKIHRETQDQVFDFVMRIAANFARKIFDGLRGELLGMDLFQHLLDAFQFVFGNQRLAQLLQMQRRMKLCRNRANLVPRQNVVQHFMLLQPLQQLRKQLRTHRTKGLRLRGRIEQPPRILRIVQKIAKPRIVVFEKKIQFLFGSLNLRTKFLELQLLMLQPQLDIIHRSFDVGGIAGPQKFVQETVAAVQLLAQQFPLPFQIGDFVAHGLRLVQHGLVTVLRFHKIGFPRDRHPGLLQKFLEQFVHRFKAIRVAHIISQQHKMFEEIRIVFAAVQKNQPVLQQIVERGKIVAE